MGWGSCPRFERSNSFFIKDFREYSVSKNLSKIIKFHISFFNFIKSFNKAFLPLKIVSKKFFYIFIEFEELQRYKK